MTKDRTLSPEAERIRDLFTRLGDMQRWGDGPRIGLRISGGKAYLMVLNEEDASVHDIAQAREKRCRDRNVRKSSDPTPPVPKSPKA